MNNKAEKSFGKKHISNLKLTASDPEFSLRVDVIRKHLKIPTELYYYDFENRDFFKKGSDELNQITKDWYGRMTQESDDIIESDNFKKQRRQIEDKNDSGNLKKSEYNLLIKELYQQIPLNYFENEIVKIIQEFNLPVNYSKVVKQYIIFGNFNCSVPGLPFSIKTDFGDLKRREVCLSFTEKVTDKDLKEVKKYVNQYFGKALPKINPIHNVDQKLIAERYYMNRDVYDSVYATKYRLSLEEIAENVAADSGKKFKTNKVYDAVRELKSLRHKRRYGKK